jgi:hypothetical protein
LKTVTHYVDFLKGKGFNLREDTIGFIKFGQNSTNATEEITIAAIELTLKTQKEFDGSFFISLLETFVKNKVKNRGAAIRFAKEQQLIAI